MNYLEIANKKISERTVKQNECTQKKLQKAEVSKRQLTPLFHELIKLKEVGIVAYLSTDENNLPYPSIQVGHRTSHDSYEVSYSESCFSLRNHNTHNEADSIEGIMVHIIDIIV